MLVNPGVCKYCGCSGTCRCPDGGPCGWADAEMTICTGCLDKLPLAELNLLFFAELDLVGNNSLTVEVSVTDLMCVLGHLQLGLRHPGVQKMQSWQRARQVCDRLKAQFTELGLAAMAELARRGDDPQHDLPVPGYEHARAFRRN